MFDKHYYIQEDKSDKAARIVNKALEKLGGDLHSISQAEIEARDRVNITLKEYEQLKDDVAKYERRLSDIGRLIIRLGIPAEAIERIDLDSVRVMATVDACNLKKRCRIEFDINDI